MYIVDVFLKNKASSSFLMSKNGFIISIVFKAINDWVVINDDYEEKGSSI